MCVCFQNIKEGGLDLSVPFLNEAKVLKNLKTSIVVSISIYFLCSSFIYISEKVWMNYLIPTNM